MAMTAAVRTCLRKYVDFTGRARRAEHWWFYLASVLITAVFYVPAVILFFAAAAASAPAADSSGLTAGGGVLATVGLVLYGLAFLVSLALVLPTLAVGARRLHDTDRSGWWLLLGLVPLGGIVVLVFHVLDGTPGPNRFGPSPKGVAPYGGPTSGFDQGAQGYGYPAQA